MSKHTHTYTNEKIEQYYDNKFDLAKAAIVIAREMIAKGDEVQMGRVILDLEKQNEKE